MRIRVLKSEKGIVLVAVAVVTLILTILGFSVLSMASSEILLARNDINKTKAFYLAEAGVEVLTANLSGGNFASIGETALGGGSYRVDINSAESPPYAVATGTIGGQAKRIKVTTSFLAPPYECGIYAGGLGGPWTLILRGTGDPCGVFDFWGNKTGNYNGKDIINGNIFVDGNVAMYQESRVEAAPPPNDYHLNGDVDATGDIGRYDSATIAGEANDHAPAYGAPDLVGMNYAVNNTHNVAQIFADACAAHTLPVGNELRDVFQKNPTDRGPECGTTVGVDDYFFEPTSGFVTGGPWSGDTPLHAGDDRVYYVSGDVWVHSKPTYGFKMDGKVTIVATGNIHICDNLQYADSSRDMLCLVALGNDGSGGNIYFGDPGYGNMAVFSSMMFAAKDFLYNIDPVAGKLTEPGSGFTITGNLSALNSVSIDRDWYTDAANKRRPARYNPATSQWYDSGTRAVLTSTQISTIKHYQMVINYDDRVRTQGTQPLGLPRGTGLIFCGLANWKELP